MNTIFTDRAKEDIAHWKKYNSKIQKRIEQLIDDIKKHPFTGIGRPEPLRFKYSGYWSRRINREHRLVYKIDEDDIYILQCRYHY